MLLVQIFIIIYLNTSSFLNLYINESGIHSWSIWPPWFFFTCLFGDCCYFFFTWLSVISICPQRFSHGYLHRDLCSVLGVSLTGISTVISTLSSAIPSRVSPQWSLLFPHVSFTVISHRLNLISAICLFMDWTCSLRFLYLQAHLATRIFAILFHGWSLQFLFYGHLSMIAYRPIFSLLFTQRDFSRAYLYDLLIFWAASRALLFGEWDHLVRDHGEDSTQCWVTILLNGRYLVWDHDINPDLPWVDSTLCWVDIWSGTTM